MPATPFIGVLPVEQDNGARRRFRAEGWTGARSFLHGVWAGSRDGDADFPASQFSLEFILARENDLCAVTFAFNFVLRLLVPARTRQPTLVGDEAKLVFSQRDHLRPAPIIQ